MSIEPDPDKDSSIESKIDNIKAEEPAPAKDSSSIKSKIDNITTELNGISVTQDQITRANALLSQAAPYTNIDTNIDTSELSKLIKSFENNINNSGISNIDNNNPNEDTNEKVDQKIYEEAKKYFEEDPVGMAVSKVADFYVEFDNSKTITITPKDIDEAKKVVSVNFEQAKIATNNKINKAINGDSKKELADLKKVKRNIEVSETIANKTVMLDQLLLFSNQRNKEEHAPEYLTPNLIPSDIRKNGINQIHG